MGDAPSYYRSKRLSSARGVTSVRQSFASNRDFDNQAVEHQPVVKAGGDKRLVSLESGLHDLLEILKIEKPRIFCR